MAGYKFIFDVISRWCYSGEWKSPKFWHNFFFFFSSNLHIVQNWRLKFVRLAFNRKDFMELFGLYIFTLHHPFSCAFFRPPLHSFIIAFSIFFNIFFISDHRNRDALKLQQQQKIGVDFRFGNESREKKKLWFFFSHP